MEFYETGPHDWRSECGHYTVSRGIAGFGITVIEARHDLRPFWRAAGHDDRLAIEDAKAACVTHKCGHPYPYLDVTTELA